VCFDGSCVECNPTGGPFQDNGDCMCPASMFCDKDESSDTYKTCVAYSAAYNGDPSKLDTTCDPDISAQDASVIGLYDSGYCGLVSLPPSSLLLTFLLAFLLACLLWTSHKPHTKQIIVNSTAPTGAQLLGVNWAGNCHQGRCQVCQSGSGECSGERTCIAGAFAQPSNGLLSWAWVAQIPFSFSAMMVLLWLYFCFPCCLFAGGFTWAKQS
jgi:hypothetical protein